MNFMMPSNTVRSQRLEQGFKNSLQPTWSNLGGLFVLLCLGWGATSVSAADKPFTAVAVWDFENVSPPTQSQAQDLQLEYLRRSLSESMTQSLIKIPGLKLVDRLQLRRVMAELSLGADSLADQDTRLKVGRVTGAQCMLFGSFLAMADQVRVDLRLVDTQTSQIVFADSFATGTNQVMSESVQLGNRLARRIFGSADAVVAKTYSTHLWIEYDRVLELMDARQYDQAFTALTALLQEADFEPARRVLPVLMDLLSRQ